MEPRGFKGLEVWQRSIDLAKRCYLFPDCLPSSERFGLTGQIRRAATSIPANIAEGYGRRNPGSYIQFLRIAKGSLNELETHLILCQELQLSTAEESVFDLINEVGTKLSNLIRKVQGPGVREEMAEYDATRPT